MRSAAVITILFLLAVAGIGRLTGADATPKPAPTTQPSPLDLARAIANPWANSLKAQADAELQLAADFKTLRGQKGFWRIGQANDGVWWFVAPDGKREFLNTVTTV